jgi:hypothetical protein
VIENNAFTRSASDVITVGGPTVTRTVGRQLAINFARNVVIQNDTFAVSDGVLKFNSDGETIQNEAGGPNPREDSGIVTAADASSITDNSKCAGTCPWRFYPDYSMAVIVSGAGAGQWRRITAQAGNTFAVDRPFDVVPVPGDHFTIRYPAYENALIRANKMSDNPMGIDLHHGAMLNVSVIGNTLTNNGGIALVPSQRNIPADAPDPKSVFANSNLPFSVYRNIEVVGNTITNSLGRFPAFIQLNLQFNTQTKFWGKAAQGLEIRDNQIVGRSGTPYYRSDEGYNVNSIYQNPNAPYVEEGKGALIGTVLQGNKCTNCPVSYTVDTGSIDTTIWNATTVTSPGIVSTFLRDYPFASSTKTGSIGTVTGHD